MLCAASLGAVAATTSVPAAGASRDPWQVLLARIPASGSFGDQVVLNDFAAAREASGLDRKPDRVHDLLVLEQEAGVATSELIRAPAQGDPLDDELGIRARDVERDVVAGSPPDDLTILEGSIDPDRVRRAVETDDTWADLLEAKRYGGEKYYSWGPRRVQVQRRTPLRTIGIGGNLAIDPPYAIWSDSAVSIKRSIDAAAGDVESLADDRDLVAVANALHAAGAYSAFLSTDEVAPGATTGGPTPLAPYQAVATGPGLDGKQHLLLVALAYQDAATAKTQAARLRAIAEDGTSVSGAPWTELVTIGEITTKGRVVLGTFVAERARLWFDTVLRRDSLLATD
jgi:hypothetical protein